MRGTAPSMLVDVPMAMAWRLLWDFLGPRADDVDGGMSRGAGRGVASGRVCNISHALAAVLLTSLLGRGWSAAMVHAMMLCSTVLLVRDAVMRFGSSGGCPYINFQRVCGVAVCPGCG
jgi:hypothetical protein